MKSIILIGGIVGHTPTGIIKGNGQILGFTGVIPIGCTGFTPTGIVK